MLPICPPQSITCRRDCLPEPWTLLLLLLVLVVGARFVEHNGFTCVREVGKHAMPQRARITDRYIAGDSAGGRAGQSAVWLFCDLLDAARPPGGCVQGA